MRNYSIPLMTLMLLTASMGSPALAAEGKDQAVAVAKAWLALVDAEKYGESYDQAASIVQKAVDRKGFADQVGGVRTALGKLKSRKLKAAVYYTELPGAPKGKYWVLEYDTVYAKKTVTEVVTPTLEDGKWKISGYRFK